MMDAASLRDVEHHAYTLCRLLIYNWGGYACSAEAKLIIHISFLHYHQSENGCFKAQMDQ